MSVSEVLADLKASTTKLGVIDSQLVEAIQQIETALRTLTSTRLELACSEPLFDRVAFGKLGGVWGLQIERTGEWCELVKAPRDARAAALAGGHIKRLVLESAKQVRDQIEGRHAATAAARELLDLLTIDAPEKP
jgi:hypothetical protein